MAGLFSAAALLWRWPQRRLLPRRRGLGIEPRAAGLTLDRCSRMSARRRGQAKEK
jgi:hypothetical protein